MLVIDFYGRIFLTLQIFPCCIDHALSDNMEVCERNSCVRGYRIYKDIWDPVIGEELQCERERDNGSDRYAVALQINNA